MAIFLWPLAFAAAGSATLVWLWSISLYIVRVAC
jgi:hypothetical protein